MGERTVSEAKISLLFFLSFVEFTTYAHGTDGLGEGRSL